MVETMEAQAASISVVGRGGIITASAVDCSLKFDTLTDQMPYFQSFNLVPILILN